MGRAAGVLIGVVLLFLPLMACAQPPPAPESRFKDWAAVVVAGDWRAQSGDPTEAFDNARRDVAGALRAAGFSSVKQFSTRPGRYRELGLGHSAPVEIYRGLRDLAQVSTAGCLFYLSSHGGPEGAMVGEAVMGPHLLAALVNEACPGRPSIVVVSACFSGVFVGPLSKPDRMILTAARPDRASFGCGEADKYPYFDTCFLTEARGAHDFLALGRGVQTCVARLERETGAAPASEPQLWVGPLLRAVLPLYGFAHWRAPLER